MPIFAKNRDESCKISIAIDKKKVIASSEASDSIHAYI